MIISSFNSLAGFERKNGGDTVVCYKDKTKSYPISFELLESYEARYYISPKTNPKLIEALENPAIRSSAYLILNELYPDYVEHGLEKIYQEVLYLGYDFFMNNLNPVPGILENIDDSHQVISIDEKKFCYLEQVATNKVPMYKTQHPFNVSTFFLGLNKLDKMKLATHEVLGLCSTNISDTSELRFLVNLLYSEDVFKYSLEELDQIMKKIGITFGADIKACIDYIDEFYYEVDIFL